MKVKLIIALIIAVFLVGFCVFDEIYVAASFETLTAKLKEQEEKATFDLNELNELNLWWEQKHQKLEIIVPHIQLNEITYAFGEFLGTVIADDIKSAEGQLHRLIQTSEAMEEMFSFRLGNLL